MKNSTKLIIGLGIFAAATAAVTYAVVRELKAIRNLTINIDTLPDEEMDELMIDEAETEEAEEAEKAEELVDVTVEVTEEASEEAPVAEEVSADEAVAD